MDKPIPKLKRPKLLSGKTSKQKTGCGSIYVTVNVDKDNKPQEVFVQIGKSGGCAASQTESIGRLIAYALRNGCELKGIIKQLKGIGCHQPVGLDDAKILSCPDAIAKALEGFVKK